MPSTSWSAKLAWNATQPRGSRCMAPGVVNEVTERKMVELGTFGRPASSWSSDDEGYSTQAKTAEKERNRKQVAMPGKLLMKRLHGSLCGLQDVDSQWRIRAAVVVSVGPTLGPEDQAQMNLKRS